MGQLPASVAAYREGHRGKHIGPRYSGWLHFTTTTVGASAAIAWCIWRVTSPTVLELALVPAFFLVANLAEYFGHRGPMHHRSARLSVLFERHTQQHHRFFTHDAMDVESARDFQMVLFPPAMLVFFLGGVGPLGALIGVATTSNIGYLFVATSFGYFLLYEWMHWAYHQPQASWIGGNRLIARLRRHHLVHHDPTQMTSVNFNITFPIGDMLFGTNATQKVDATSPVV